MNKQLLFLLLFAFSGTISYSQNTFDQGYFVNNSDQKIECLIYNIDWKNNPTKFDYKTDENAEIQTESIENIKEFSVNDASKFIRKSVQIDRSSDDTRSR